MSNMLGVVLGLGTSSLVVALSVRMYRRLTDPDECRLIESFMAKDGDINDEAFHGSRPGMLLHELESVHAHPELAVATFNDTLSEVDMSTRVGRQTARLLARAALMGGVAGACAEISLNVHVSTMHATIWGLCAMCAGLLGTASCTVIGQRATIGLERRRRLWDDFVQWILNSQFPRSELIVPGWTGEAAARLAIRAIRD